MSVMNMTGYPIPYLPSKFGEVEESDYCIVLITVIVVVILVILILQLRG